MARKDLIFETNGATGMMWHEDGDDDYYIEENLESAILIEWWVVKGWEYQESPLPEPVKSWYAFAWWYTTSWFDNWTMVNTWPTSSDDNTGSVTLYAKYDECTWWSIVNNKCYEQKMVIYNANGWEFSGWDIVKTVQYIVENEWSQVWTTDRRTPNKAGNKLVYINFIHNHKYSLQ